MSPVHVQRRRALVRSAGRRRPGGPARSGGEAAPRLFPDGGDATAFVDASAPARDTDAPRAAGGERPASQATAAGSAGGRGEGTTLEELVNALWDGVLAEEQLACPLCGGDLVGRASAHARPTEGRCRDCGTTIG